MGHVRRLRRLREGQATSRSLWRLRRSIRRARRVSTPGRLSEIQVDATVVGGRVVLRDVTAPMGGHRCYPGHAGGRDRRQRDAERHPLPPPSPRETKTACCSRATSSQADRPGTPLDSVRGTASDRDVMTTQRQSLPIRRAGALDRGRNRSPPVHGQLRLATKLEHMDGARTGGRLATDVGVPVRTSSRPARRLNCSFGVDGRNTGRRPRRRCYVGPRSLDHGAVSPRPHCRRPICRRLGSTGLARDRLTGWTGARPPRRSPCRDGGEPAGQWARRGRGAPPASPCAICSLRRRHLVTERVAELSRRDAELPVLRDTAGSFYVRQELTGSSLDPRASGRGLSGTADTFPASTTRSCHPTSTRSATS